ncbi:hypothetical protein C6A87_004830 [Mycobacterium sp. ITM-2016-00317]|uniref:hypothetical protein n=1 Tax=Mycobacterium sp. ITM-2016-00317 TaxID=2099694 RepID=UPI00287FA9A9|nr:hypothetical protein [Mycobacterium sp. ITM-2016-00317]WNG88567.1 hypothetical protein C6A87_004830 [Mycobacterium sp. ITM-2016-00317]
MSSAVTVDARASGAWVRRYARTTPGVVVLIAVAVAALGLAAGLVCAAALNDRINQQKAVLVELEPVAYAAQNLYAASSAADAAAATIFLSGGTQTPLMRARYQQALAAAAGALADATAGAPDVATRTTLAGVSAHLTTYTGLVEAARANNIQGFPVGSAYLREASSLMQTRLLPAAESVYAADLARVDEGQRRVADLPAIGLLLWAATLVVIGAGSAVLSRRTHRVFNVGLVVAAAIVLVVMGGVVGAVRLAGDDIARARSEGTARFGALSEARILAQQARTEETLQLITRGDITAGETAFYGRIDELLALAGGEVPAVTEAVDSWVDSHRRQVEAYRAGDYPAAVDQALGIDRRASGAQFALVESALRDAIEQARGTMRGYVAGAARYLGWTPTAVLGSTIAVIAVAVAGLWPRLKEFL